MAEEQLQPADTLAPYRAAVAEHGPTFRATLWRSEEKQRVRFEALASMVDLTGRSVLDVGSGLGDLPAYLSEVGVAYERVVALEGVPELSEQASRRLLERAEHVVGDFVSEPGVFGEIAKRTPIDVAIFSGSLNAMEPALALGCVASAWEVVRCAVVFNFISARSGLSREQAHPAVPFEPLEVLSWAMQRTPMVALRHDYLGAHDATVAMFK